MRFWMGLGKGFGVLVGVRRLAGLSPIVGLLLLPVSLLVLAFLSYFLWLNFKSGWELSDGRGWKTIDMVPQAVANGLTVAPNGDLFAVGGVQKEGNICWLVRKRDHDAREWKNADEVCNSDPNAATVAFKALAVSDKEIFVVGSTRYYEGPHSLSRIEWIVRRSKDGGSTWETSDRFESGSGKNLEIRYATMPVSIAAPGSKVFVAGLAYSQGAMIREIDLASTKPEWKTVHELKSDGVPVKLSSTGKALILGIADEYKIVLYSSTDEGRSWGEMLRAPKPGTLGKDKQLGITRACRECRDFRKIVKFSFAFSHEGALVTATKGEQGYYYYGGTPIAWQIGGRGIASLFEAESSNEEGLTYRGDSLISQTIAHSSGYYASGIEGPYGHHKREHDANGLQHWTVWKVSEGERFQTIDKFAIKRKFYSIANDIAASGEQLYVAGESGEEIFVDPLELFLDPHEYKIKTATLEKHTWIVRRGPIK